MRASVATLACILAAAFALTQRAFADPSSRCDPNRPECRSNSTEIFLAGGLWTMISGTRAVPAYQAMVIVRPSNDQTIFDNAGDLDIDIQLTPALDGDSGDVIVLVIDGKRVAQQRRPHFEIGAIDRGTHTLQAMVITPEGETAIASPVLQFHMWQASAQFPQRREH